MATTIPDIKLAPNQKAERKLLVTMVDVDGEMEVLGAGIEESVIEFNPDIVTVTDILGITETTVNKFEEQQSFDPNTLRGGQKLNAKLLDVARRRAFSELTSFTVVRAWGVLTDSASVDAGPYAAEQDTNCTIIPQSIGGASYIDMPIQLSFSGDREFGTVDKLTGGAKFTPKTTAI